MFVYKDILAENWENSWGNLCALQYINFNELLSSVYEEVNNLQLLKYDWVSVNFISNKIWEWNKTLSKDRKTSPLWKPVQQLVNHEITVIWLYMTRDTSETRKTTFKFLLLSLIFFLSSFSFELASERLKYKTLHNHSKLKNKSVGSMV